MPAQTHRPGKPPQISVHHPVGSETAYNIVARIRDVEIPCVVRSQPRGAGKKGPAAAVILIPLSAPSRKGPGALGIDIPHHMVFPVGHGVAFAVGYDIPGFLHAHLGTRSVPVSAQGFPVKPFLTRLTRIHGSLIAGNLPNYFAVAVRHHQASVRPGGNGLRAEHRLGCGGRSAAGDDPQHRRQRECQPVPPPASTSLYSSISFYRFKFFHRLPHSHAPHFLLSPNGMYRKSSPRCSG